MILWGIYFAFVRIPVEELGWFLPSYIGYFFAPVLLLLMRARGERPGKPTANHALPYFVMLVLLSTLGSMSYNIGISLGFTSIVAPISGAYPVVFVVISSVVFKEKLHRQQLVGTICSLAGIVMLSLFS